MRQRCTTLGDLPWPVLIHTHINSAAVTRRCVHVRGAGIEAAGTTRRACARNAAGVAGATRSAAFVSPAAILAAITTNNAGARAAARKDKNAVARKHHTAEPRHTREGRRKHVPLGGTGDRYRWENGEWRIVHGNISGALVGKGSDEAKLPRVNRLVRAGRDRFFYQLLRGLRHLFQIAEDQHQFAIGVVFDHFHIGFAKRLVLRQQRLEVLGPDANEHFAPVSGVAHALYKSLLFEPVEDVRDGSGGQAGQARKPTSRDNAFRMKPDQAQAPGIGGIQSDRLSECLMQQNRLRAEFSGQISQPPQHFRFFRRLGQIFP